MIKMMNKDIFKIVRILDEYRLIINAGSDANVVRSCRFYVMGEKSDVIDIDTNERLGFIPVIKDIVKPVFIEEKFCICEGCEDVRYKMSDTTPLLFSQSRKLNINVTQITGSYMDTPINICDKVIMVTDSNKEEQGKVVERHKKIRMYSRIPSLLF